MQNKSDNTQSGYTYTEPSAVYVPNYQFFRIYCEVLNQFLNVLSFKLLEIRTCFRQGRSEDRAVSRWAFSVGVPSSMPMPDHWELVLHKVATTQVFHDCRSFPISISFLQSSIPNFIILLVTITRYRHVRNF